MIAADLIKPEEIKEFDDSKALMIIGTEDCLKELKEFLPELNNQYFGAVFPGVIFRGRKYENRLIAVRLDCDVEIFRNDKLPEISGKTLLVFADGLYDGVEDVIEEAFLKYGHTVCYIGGGAGSISFKETPCLFDNRGFFNKGCLFASLPLESRVSASHGWKTLDVDSIATKTNRREIIELDWQPAFDVYRNVLAERGETVNERNFFDVSKNYPFGISKVEGEPLVRDPLMVRESSIFCAGKVPQNSVVRLMEGDRDSLIQAAKECAERVEGETFFLCDCISRVLYLEEDFEMEMKVVSREAFGPLTIGEIACSGEFIEFHNKTIVVGGLDG